MTTAIELDGVGRAYGERAALAGVTLSLPAGQTLVVFGPNGAGKSTLLRVLATLLRPTAGTAKVLGGELPGDAWKVRGRVGLLGHDPLLYRELSARENLRYHARLHKVPAARVEELLDAVGLHRRGDDPISTLLARHGAARRAGPGGAARARAAAARRAAREPRSRRRRGPAAAADRNPGARRTRVITSHDPSGGLAEADVALGLRDGRVALLAPAAEVTAAQIGELYR